MWRWSFGLEDDEEVEDELEGVPDADMVGDAREKVVGKEAVKRKQIKIEIPYDMLRFICSIVLVAEPDELSGIRRTCGREIFMVVGDEQRKA